MRVGKKTEKEMQKMVKLTAPEIYSNEENLMLMQLF
jgi:hypothetical protein